MELSVVLTIAIAAMVAATPPVHPNSFNSGRFAGAVPVEEPLQVTAEERQDFGSMMGGGGGFPMPMLPGLGSFLPQPKLPFEAISGPYVSSSIGPVFNSGPFGGLGIPFSPGPLGGVMGIPLAMIAMG